jgi:large subunit ribosomal protein L21
LEQGGFGCRKHLPPKRYNESPGKKVQKAACELCQPKGYLLSLNKSIELEFKMFAIVEACGRQYQLEAGRFVDLDLANASAGDAFQFDKVLMIVDGAESTVGVPYIDGAKVTGRVLSHMKGRKVIVYHMRPKKGTRKKQGHRQHYTRVVIDTIELKDKVLAKSDSTAKPEKKAKPEAKPKATKAPKAEAKKPTVKKAAPAKKTKK